MQPHKGGRGAYHGNDHGKQRNNSTAHNLPATWPLLEILPSGLSS
jgi:hypothetical protein